MMPRVNLMYCCLCHKSHDGQHLRRGWYATGIKHLPKEDEAKSVICTQCKNRIIKQGKDGQ